MVGGAQPSPLSYSVVIPTKDRWDDADATLDVVLNQTRVQVRRQPPDACREQALLEADGTLVGTTGACQRGLDPADDGTRGSPLRVSLANTQEPLFLVNRPASRPSESARSSSRGRSRDPRAWASTLTPFGDDPGLEVVDDDMVQARDTVGPGVAYVAVLRYLLGDFRPYAYRTDEWGKTWKSLLTDKGSVRGYALNVEQDPVDKDLLFLGTEWGLWFSQDGGR